MTNKLRHKGNALPLVLAVVAIVVIIAEIVLMSTGLVDWPELTVGITSFIAALTVFFAHRFSTRHTRRVSPEDLPEDE